MRNIDEKVVTSFGAEWSHFDQKGLPPSEMIKVFNEYFAVFPWGRLSSKSEGFDMGCGSGRWARHVAPRVGKLHCIDPSNAIAVAKEHLVGFSNVEFHQASLDNSGIGKGSQDFGYSLGVLHHVPNTALAICSCVELLKPNAPLLLYIYYAFDNRPTWFKYIWKLSDLVRRLISALPNSLKPLSTDAIAILIYWPLSRLALATEKIGLNLKNMPLYYYRNHSIYTLRTDARDRFGTSLERRFTKEQIKQMMLDAGLVDIRFSDTAPYWCAVGFKSI